MTKSKRTCGASTRRGAMSTRDSRGGRRPRDESQKRPVVRGQKEWIARLFLNQFRSDYRAVDGYSFHGGVHRFAVDSGSSQKGGHCRLSRSQIKEIDSLLRRVAKSRARVLKAAAAPLAEL